MKLLDEDQILDQNTRVMLIEEINNPLNKTRKRDTYKKYEIYKDRVKRYIVQSLQDELDPQTVKEMMPRISSINLFKKVINKKARVYKTAPKREVTFPDADEAQESFDWLVDSLNLNVTMKKANRYLEAFYNTDVFVRPLKDTVTNKWYYRAEPLVPYQYDVVEDANDSQRALGYIISEYDDDYTAALREGSDGRANLGTAKFRDGDNKDSALADSPIDEQPMHYIWWGNKYHLTFDQNGEIISKDLNGEAAIENPIGEIPIVSLARDRDDSFWALGGEDLIDGTILINTIISDIFYIAKLHGTGLFYLFGKGVPKTFKVGPNRGITIDVEDGDPTPSIGFANANPQLTQHKDLVEQYLALLLTTNDLEPGSVQGKLEASSASSGIQEMIIKAEPMNAIEDDQELFYNCEPKIVQKAIKWHNLYLDKGLLVDELAEIGKLPEDLEYAMKFGAIQPFQSEKEKLEVIEKRIALGISTLIDALMIDNPDMSYEEAEKKALELAEEKAKKVKTAMENMINGQDDADAKVKKDEKDDLSNESEDEEDADS